MKILYVEDNEDNVYVVKSRLTRAGFTILIAADGAQGVAMASTEQPDLILMDLQLPGIDGAEALRRIRASERSRAVPVVAVTAFAMDHDREHAFASGFTGYVEKPISVRLLPQQVRDFLQLGGAR